MENKNILLFFLNCDFAQKKTGGVQKNHTQKKHNKLIQQKKKLIRIQQTLTKGEHKRQNFDEDPLFVWLDFKFWGHVGFVLEALLESFPQSILQMVAMVYFQNISFASFFFFVSFFFFWSECV